MNLGSIVEVAIAVGGVGLASFCFILTHRLRRLNDLESGLGGAIAVMAAEVDRLEKAIITARDEARTASEALAAEVTRSRSERAHWDLQRKLAGMAPLPVPAEQRSRKLRKRLEQSHA